MVSHSTLSPTTTTTTCPQPLAINFTLTLTLMTMCPCPLPLNNDNVALPSLLHSLSPWWWHTPALILLTTTMTCPHHHLCSCPCPNNNMKMIMCCCPHPLLLGDNNDVLLLSSSSWWWHIFSHILSLWQWHALILTPALFLQMMLKDNNYNNVPSSPPSLVIQGPVQNCKKDCNWTGPTTSCNQSLVQLHEIQDSNGPAAVSFSKIKNLVATGPNCRQLLWKIYPLVGTISFHLPYSSTILGIYPG